MVDCLRLSLMFACYSCKHVCDWLQMYSSFRYHSSTCAEVEFKCEICDNEQSVWVPHQRDEVESLKLQVAALEGKLALLVRAESASVGVALEPALEVSPLLAEVAVPTVLPVSSLSPTVLPVAALPPQSAFEAISADSQAWQCSIGNVVRCMDAPVVVPGVVAPRVVLRRGQKRTCRMSTGGVRPRVLLVGSE